MVKVATTISHQGENSLKVISETGLQPGSYKLVPRGIVQVLEGGTTIFPEFDLVPIEEKKLTLESIWLSKELSLDTFILFCSRANWKSRQLIEETQTGELAFTAGAMEIRVTYDFLSKHKVIKPNLKATEIYKAFTGSFRLYEVSNPRALQDRSRGDYALKQFEKRKAVFRDFLENLFQFIVRNPANEQNTTDI